MIDFQFENPSWLHAIWGVVALAILLVALELRGTSLLQRFMSTRMQGKLLRQVGLARRIVAKLLFCVALVALVFALMRPQWGGTMQTMSRVDSQIMVCLDVSKSMLAEDVVPSRLERAKAELDSLLSLLANGQQVGLIAFAGKATVLCPMTTDFGFLRLILSEASPASVGLGGTKIGDAIRVAVDGFRTGGDINRLLLVITDGEDHESFPLDAAAYAREKGVRIVSIGFGDEQGSKIEITDPQTGRRSFLLDRDGAAVVSRLDGETLREIALETEGAYIPAGTGALDLESIYNSHIATMLEGSSTQEQRIVRNEAYQWFVILALVLWLASILTAAPRRLPLPKQMESSLASLVLACLLSWLAPSLQADDAINPPASGEETAADVRPTSEAREIETEAEAISPREAYNRAIANLKSDPDRAEELLNDARSRAGVDGELRFRAVYNLGWVDVARADALLEENPEEALKHLQLASGRFREAVRLRSLSQEARHNLEVVSQRILALADSLANKDPGDIAKRLDEVIIAQNAHLAQLQQIVGVESVEQAATEEKRSLFRQLGVTQRMVISQLDELSTDAQRELENLSKADDAGQAEQALRAAQLSGMLNYIDQSMNWMSKSRSFTRRLQANPAFLRWASAVRLARQARDQLRDPVEILSNLIADAVELQQLTQQKANGSPLLGGPAEQVPAWLSVDYLEETQQHTLERTSQLRGLLAQGLESATPPASGSGAGNQPSAPAQPEDPQQAELRESITEALPLLESASHDFESAIVQIGEGGLTEATGSQAQAIEALSEAAELFFDLRRLIEATYATEQYIQSGMQAGNQQAELPLAELTQALQPPQQKNLARCARLRTLLERELSKLPSSPESGGPGAGGTAPPADDEAAAQQAAQERQRLETALALLSAAQTAMQAVDLQLTEVLANPVRPASDSSTPAEVPAEAANDNKATATEEDEEEKASETSADVEIDPELPPIPAEETPEKTPSAEPATETISPETGSNLDLPQAEETPSEAATVDVFPMQNVDRSVKNLEDLRRLFFSIVEHLRDTAGRQAELNQDTAQSLSSAQELVPEQLGPLSSKQQSLEHITGAIAQALGQQAEQERQAAEAGQDAGAPPGQPVDPQANPGENAEKLETASKLVAEAQVAQQTASQALAAEPDAVLEETRSQVETAQTTALERLAEALQVLEPPQQNPPDQDQQDEQNSDDQQSQDGQGEGEQEQPSSAENQNGESAPEEQKTQNMTAEQMLQAIRDREARRRDEQQKARVMSSGQVDRDW